jgi:rod shape-determining protein MreD
MTLSPQLLGRLALLALATVLAQVAAVSQVSVLGVSADLSPLVVMAVGLLCGSVAGAAIGFGVGLFVDLALLQTLGVSSLILLTVGYASGRLRELRDPAHPLTPVAVGVAATAGATIGFSLIQFLLGIDAPVSLMLIREILATIVVNAALALPAYGLVRRVLAPYVPDDRRRRRRRAYMTGGLSPISRA